jgi:ABC-type uncharacterized transport system permease subunit
MVGATALAYALSSAGFFFHMATRGGSLQAIRIARILMWIGVVFNVLFVVHQSFASRVCPVKTIHLGISLGAVAAGLVVLLARKGMRVQALGTFIAPIALVFVLAARWIGVPEVTGSFHSHLLPLHVSSNILGIAFLWLASGTASMYLVQARQLKAKRGASVFGRVSPLEALDRATYRFLRIGYVFITVGAVTGTFWVSRLTVGTASELLRISLGYMTWLVFSTVVLLRFILGWRGKRAAYGTLAGFLLSMIVVSLYLIKAGLNSP